MIEFPKQILIRFTKEQYESIVSKANNNKVPPSTLIREILFKDILYILKAFTCSLSTYLY